MEAQRMYSCYSFMTSALDWVSGQCHALAVLYPQGKDPWYPLYRRLGGPQMDTEVRGKILCLCRESNLDCPVTSP
jgi:hypothetical protein